MRCEVIDDRSAAARGALACEGCGCTEDDACEGGCYWVSLDPPICSACEDDTADISAGGVLFNGERCPESPVGGPHDKLWIDEISGYCVRCRAGFTT